MHIFELLVGIIFFSLVIASIITFIKVTKEDDRETLKIKEKYKEKDDD